MRPRILLVLALIATALAPLPAVAQQGPARQFPVAGRPDLPAGRALPAPIRGTTVMGFAWSVSNEPITDATVRLRNVLSGAVEATVVTSQTGEFVFEGIEGGATYVVELVGENDAVRAVGQPFSIAPGETVATFVRLGPASGGWLMGWFGGGGQGAFMNTASAVVSTAASLGVTAVVPPSQDISASR